MEYNLCKAIVVSLLPPRTPTTSVRESKHAGRLYIGTKYKCTSWMDRNLDGFDSSRRWKRPSEHDPDCPFPGEEKSVTWDTHATRSVTRLVIHSSTVLIHAPSIFKSSEWYAYFETCKSIAVTKDKNLQNDSVQNICFVEIVCFPLICVQVKYVSSNLHH